MAAILATKGLKAVVLETYGSGNAPRKEWFLRRLHDACEQGIIIVNVTQCSAGTVEMERYETGYHRCRQELSADMTAQRNLP